MGIAPTSNRRIVVQAGGVGPTFDIILQNDNGLQFFARTAIGSPAMVETFDSVPAWVATSEGTVASQRDPSPH